MTFWSVFGWIAAIAPGVWIPLQVNMSAYIRSLWAQRPGHGFFFRAEYEERFASLLEQRENDPGFIGNPYRRYGGRSLHQRSHGEASQGGGLFTQK